jgi:hypothetical protein
MKKAAQFISWLALALTLVPSCLLFASRLSLDDTKAWMLVATVLWFLATPLWMERQGG